MSSSKRGYSSSLSLLLTFLLACGLTQTAQPSPPPAELSAASEEESVSEVEAESEGEAALEAEPASEGKTSLKAEPLREQDQNDPRPLAAGRPRHAKRATKKSKKAKLETEGVGKESAQSDKRVENFLESGAPFDFAGAGSLSEASGDTGAGPVCTGGEESTRWNVWLERTEGDKPKQKPVTIVRPGHRYLVVLNVSKEMIQKAGVSSQFPSEAAKKTLCRDQEQASFAITLLPDPSSFEFSTPSAPLELERRDTPNGVEISGTVGIPIRTRSDVVGKTSLALLVWSDDTPIDEIVVSLCISDQGISTTSCPAPSIDQADQDPIVGVSTEARSPRAALHLVELRERGMMGLFKSRGQKPIGWRIGMSAEDFAATINQAVLPPLTSAVKDENDHALLMAGRTLFNMVFPPRRRDVQKRVRDFVLAAASSGEQGPPRIHVRATSPRSASPILVPLGVAVLPQDNDDGETYVVGDYFEVETPLATRQRLPRGCPKRWVVVAPTAADQELNAATSDEVFKPHWGGAKIKRFFDLETFRKWANASEPQPSTAFLVVSHHNDGRIWFDPDKPLALEELTGSYHAPSLLILNACGTAQTGGASAFAAMNARGVNGGIATLTEVSGAMAGSFMQCLGDQIDVQSTQISLGEAHFKAVRCLREKKSAEGRAYGLRALTYISMGDTEAAICTPN